jgi:5-methyltetrahydrofolate--homocysteine methyltransferase
MPRTFLERLNAGETLVSDGATGTNLQARGLAHGKPTELWLLEEPEQIKKLHREFIDAGSDIILTNTFGASSVRLGSEGLGERAVELNTLAARLGRQAANGTDVLVGGSIGPTGQLLKPLGPLDPDEAYESFAAQARALTEAGVDLLVVETQFDIAEATRAVQAARSVSSLPLVISFSYDRGTRTMMGVKPAQMVREFSGMGVTALGVNCGRSLEDNLQVLKELKEASTLPLWFKPNAGLPKLDSNDRAIFDVTPQAMGERATEAISIGARILGGCCGTSPEHLRQIARAVKG